MFFFTKNLLGSLALFVCVGCGPLLTSNIVEVKKPDGTISFTHQTAIPTAGVLLEEGTDFSNVVLADPALGGATYSATYQSNAYRSEVDLYALDPRPLLATWDANAFDHTLLEVLRGGTVPKIFPIANPIAGNFDPPALHPVTQSIPLNYFFPGASGSTHLREAAFYNYGWCATEVSHKADILKTIAQKIIASIGAPDRKATVDLYSFVTFDGSPVGGFLLYISADVPTIPGSSNVGFDISRRYLFTLNAGALSLTLEKAQDDISKFYCTGGGSDFLCATGTLQKGVRDKVMESLDGIPGSPGLIDQFHQAALDRQSIRVLEAPPTPGGDLCTTDSDCPDVGSIFRADGGLLQGADQLAKVFSWSSTQKDTFVSNARKYAENASNWRCAPESGDLPAKVCKLIVRAEGLNVFPNALQLVFLAENSSGLSSGAVGTALAYQDASGGLVASTCNAQHGINVAPGGERSTLTHVQLTYP